MTFSEIRTEIMDRLGYSSPEATTRVGRAINRLYREVGTSIGMSFLRQAPVSKVVSIGNPNVTFTATEKVLQVWRLSGSTPTILDEILLAEMKEGVTPSSDVPTTWALVSTSNNSVTIRINASPATAYTLYADAIVEVTDLSGSQEPNIPESFHDILIEGVLKDEYKRLEKVKLAQESENTFARRTSDLRMFVAKSNYLLVQQGKLAETEPSRAGSGGSASFGTTPLVITVPWTFDLDPSAPFVVTDSSAYVANLFAEGIGNMASQRLVGKDVGTGESEQLTVGGGIEFTGTGSIRTSAFTGDVTKGAGGTVLTIQPGTVDFARMQSIPTNSLIGRDAAGSGTPESILLNSTLEMDGAGNLQRAGIGGDVSVPAASNTATIQSGVVSYAKMQDVSAASRLLGRGSAAGSGDVEELTVGSRLTLSGTTLSADVQVAGADTQVQFNDGGAFAGDSGLNFNKTTDILSVNGGIGFPAVQVPSGNDNVLDDYEEGSWTPALSSAGGGSATYTTQNGRYIKIGAFVFCTFILTINVDSFSAGAITLTGLPFTSAASPAGGGMVQVFSNMSNNMITITFVVNASATTAAVRNTAAAATATNSLVAADIGNATSWTGSITYLAVD